MSKNRFKLQASSGRATPGAGLAGVGSISDTTLSYSTKPPDLSFITDANIVVEFKNLTKKDATTKAKALEELKTYIREHPNEKEGGVEEPILEAWGNFYPRLSVDNSRRVRELSHNVQYELLQSARKRMEKHIPKSVGSWLAGMYDRDRVVARAAKDGVISFLNTPAKVLLFWRRCHAQILSYVQEAMDETPESLSDERTMSADDVQAKYLRVVGSALSLIINLLTTLGQDDVLSLQEKYDDLLSDKKIWSFASCEDSFVRRTSAELLVVCLDKQPHIIENNLQLINASFVGEALQSSQSTSALQLLQALNKLTLQFPHSWTATYHKKKTPISKLRVFIEKGSQGGPQEYWRTLQSLLQVLPKSVLPNDVDACQKFLCSYRNGITNREEPRSSAGEAWLSYIETASLLADCCSDQVQTVKILEQSLYPIFENFIHPTTEASMWFVGNVPLVPSRAYLACSLSDNSALSSSFSSEWQRLGDDLVTRIRTSLPEQSKDYVKSQDAIIDAGNRWFLLVTEILDAKAQSQADGAMVVPSTKIINAAIATVTSRNGKPYSAAATLDNALRLSPRLFEMSPACLEALQSFSKDCLPKLISSPSSTYLVSALTQLGQLQNQEEPFKIAWNAAIDNLLPPADDFSALPTITALVSIKNVSNFCRQDVRLQNLFVEIFTATIKGYENARLLFEAAIRNNCMTPTTERKVVDEIIQKIDADDLSTAGALKAAEFISKNKPKLLESEEDVRLAFLAKMLSLTEGLDESDASHSAILKFIEESRQIGPASSEGKATPIIHIIQNNLSSATPKSLSVDTLVMQAQAILGTSNKNALVEALLPSTQEWMANMRHILNHTPNSSLAVMRPFASAVFLVSEETKGKMLSLPKDFSGYSAPLRMSMYVASLVSEKKLWELNDEGSFTKLLYWLCVTAELLSDEVDLLDGTLFDKNSNPEVLVNLRRFLEQYQSCLNPIIKNAGTWRASPKTRDSSDTSLIVAALISALFESSNSFKNEGFYAAKALCRLLNQLVGVHGWANAGSDEWISQHLTSTRGTFGSLAIITALQENLAMSKTVSVLCNRLVSDLATASCESASTVGLLVQLNALLAVYDETDLPVVQTRLVFAVQRMLSWTDKLAFTNPGLSSEVCRALHKFLPRMKDVYGSYWASSLTFCISIWNAEGDELSSERLPMTGMSLKLFAVLRTLEAANDDLVEVFAENQEAIFKGLVNILILGRREKNVPLQFVDDLLLRLIVKEPTNLLKDVTELYPLVASDFQSIQEAGYELIHRALPEIQKEVSVNVLLDKRDARLPEELLSLLLDSPMASDLADEDIVELPASVRRYLFSWRLVYDFYDNATNKIRSDYTHILQSENYIEPLLTFLFDVLGHSGASSLNLEKSGFDAPMIRSYDMLVATSTETNEKNLQWLLINIYYLSLSYTPSLVKAWWLDCKSKQTQLAVEAWTEKYFSPLVIDDTMDEVSKWADNQESTSGEEGALIIKASKKSKDLFVGYDVDDMTMQIVMHLPSSYPLESVRVEGINRVAVTEKKWASWLRITEGVIKFSNGSLIDGLITFRKNVIGALKGGTECAICYSIISADKKMPDKRCQTCKNLFHGSCLFKWFTSSSQNTCPLCRNSFSFVSGPSRKGRGEER